ncbi:MAG: excinuclease ABC subunit UvrA [Candidatus Omnitrophica bacterium]|nr:excinuclease ABC subunit UvrA [Candidatus Omnitrophota bacterium]
MASEDVLEIRGAREHNLKNLNLKIPRNKLVVITGPSGSGKSSLAFDTIYAEGQRRYLESLSSYARQFLEKLKKPEVDYISGLSPSIAIEQRSITHNPRSTVATMTEIYDYLRLLFAKVGVARCPNCSLPLTRQQPAEITREILHTYAGRSIQIFAPVIRGRKGEFQKIFQEMLKKGYSQAKIDGALTRLKPTLKLRKSYRHDIEVLVDHLSVRWESQHQLENSVALALELAEGFLQIHQVASDASSKRKIEDRFFSTKNSCPKCLLSYPELTPNLFSFNSPYGACPTCKGLGRLAQIVKGGLIRDDSKPLLGGALNPDIFFSFNKYFIEDLLHDLTKKFDFSWDCSLRDWPQAAREAFFWGDQESSGLMEELDRLFHETNSEEIHRKVSKFLREEECSVCHGRRLRKESLAIQIKGKNIIQMSELSIDNAVPFFDHLDFPKALETITRPLLKEIGERLQFLTNVGLGYLTLDRTVATLSGGELQRIRLAAQIGVGLTGVLYVLDEPSIGLHPRDNGKLLDTLERLRSLHNTVLVVEHDEETMRRADYLVDLGPAAGAGGGYISASGAPSAVERDEKSLTGKYLSKRLKIQISREMRDWRLAPALQISGAKEHNLKNITVKIPLGLFVCVTGVSGSGKSTLTHDILYKELHNRIWKTQYKVGAFKKISGGEKIEQVIEIDQSPIGRTPRSNPATYTDLFNPIRKLFSNLAESRVRRYLPSRFSFNLRGGRCEPCRGEGYERLQMSFMPDVYVLCESCRGKRYNDATLEVRYRGKNIAEVLDLSVGEAVEFFVNISMIREKLVLLEAVGLGYLKLGQPSPTLSGGEAQRVKLTRELSKKSSGLTLYLLDEPTTGLHFADIQNLLQALFKLRDQGHTIVVIEHHLDVIRFADYVIDLGPEGGPEGGWLVASGTPREVSQNPESHTGRFLKKYIKP